MDRKIKSVTNTLNIQFAEQSIEKNVLRGDGAGYEFASFCNMQLNEVHSPSGVNHAISQVCIT